MTNKCSGNRVLFAASLGQILLSILCLCSVWACHKSQDFREAPSKLHIIGGCAATPSEMVSKSTVGVIYSQQRWREDARVCSGVLISSRTVLTARHCLDTSVADTCKVVFATEVRNAPAKQIVSGRCILYPEASANSGKTQDTYDIAMIYLDQDAPADYKPVPMLTITDDLQLGTPIILAGYGATTGRPSPGVPEGYGTLRHVVQKIGSVNAGSATFRFTVGDGYRGMHAHGDSGGPVYVYKVIDDKPTLVLAGLILSGDLNSREYGIQLDIRYFAAWITSTIQRLSGASGVVKNDI